MSTFAMGAPMAADTWTGIIIAALSSSALGAIVGGYITQRVQTHHEREEAWRNRLIDASHDLSLVLVGAFSSLGS
jgi:VIT1/CCC1 family predicted Fe2+/Mn2+ transporter